jgi:phosphatidylserine decarboxylase
MTIHKEGYKTIAICTILFGVINLLSFYLVSSSVPIISWIIFIATLGLLFFIISFFRIPGRNNRYSPLWLISNLYMNFCIKR